MSRVQPCLWVVLLYSMATYGIILPPGLRRIMEGVNNLDSFMRAFNLGNLTLGQTVRPPPPQPQVGSGLINEVEFDKFGRHKFKRVNSKRKNGKRLRLKIPKLNSVAVGRTRVVSFRDDTSPPMVLDDAHCKPYPTVIEVPQPAHHRGFHYPSHVMLHRCTGSCNTKPRVQECVATATENISLLAFVVAWNSPSDSKNQWQQGPRIIPMANHTQCGCRCISRPTDCNLALQVFAEENCRCECKAKSRRCPAYHRWDRIRCKCVCDPPSYITCPRRFQWSSDTCKCICKTSICRANKIRNRRNCRCYCTKYPLCPDGFRKARRTCKCVADI